MNQPAIKLFSPIEAPLDTIPDSQNCDWIIVRRRSQRNNSYIDNRLQSNPCATILNLIRCIFSSSKYNSLHIEQMCRDYNVEILQKYLSSIPQCFIDQELLIAIQQIIECLKLCESISIVRTLINSLVQYLLLDFNLWNKAKINVRIMHIQYLTTIIKDDRKFFRHKFGVQYLLDCIKQHF
ncbi:unnamed protein product, partial [Didymodactylos carnosus]